MISHSALEDLIQSDLENIFKEASDNYPSYVTGFGVKKKEKDGLALKNDQELDRKIGDYFNKIKG